MNREKHQWYSNDLNKTMEMLVFGHAGMPYIVFPSSRGRYFEYEDAGMIGAVADKIDRGEVQFFCPDSVDDESWYNKSIHPHDRVVRQVQYENYILHDVVPLVRAKNSTPALGVTGCSFGAYHALNFTLRHPDLLNYCVAMSGGWNQKQFLDGYYDDLCYFNIPTDYVPNMSDPWYLGHLRDHVSITLAAGDWDICLGYNYEMAKMLGAKGIPHWLDVWGDHEKHDWPLWQKMARKYF